MVNPNDARPPFRQVADPLRDDIESGRLAPGERMPSISELVERFGVTNGTVQRAMTYLRTLGLIETRHGSGSIVTPNRPWIAVTSAAWTSAAGTPLTFWAGQAAAHGFTGTQELLGVDVEVPPAEVRAALGLAGDETAVARKRLMRLDDEAVQLVTSYFPHSVADGTPLAEPQKIKGGAAAVLAESPRPPVEALEMVSSGMPTQDEAKALRLRPGVPVIRLLRSTIDADGLPVEGMVMVLSAHRHRLMYRWRIG